MGRRIITKELALKIADKLEAELSESTGGHTRASVFHEGKLIASFGIRRGSEKDKGHDFIQSQLYIGPHDAKMLAQCPLTREAWIEKIRDKGKI